MVLDSVYNYGWLSESWSLQVPYSNRDPKRDHDFDNHPYEIERLALKIRCGA